MSEKEEPYVLRFDGRIPAVRYYKNKEAGIKAREKARKNGYHVLLHKVRFPEAPTIGSEDAKTYPRPKHNNNKFLSKIADRFRRRSRKAV